MNPAKHTQPRTTGSPRIGRGAGRRQPETLAISLRDGLAGVVAMIASRDIEALREFCRQITPNPALVTAMSGMLRVLKDGAVQTWEGVPPELAKIVSLTEDHVSVMDEALDDGEIGDPDILPGCWMQVALTQNGTTRVTAGWYDMESDPQHTEYVVHFTGEFETDEAALLFLLISEMADFSVFVGHEATLN